MNDLAAEMYHQRNRAAIDLETIYKAGSKHEV